MTYPILFRETEALFFFSSDLIGHHEKKLHLTPQNEVSGNEVLVMYVLYNPACARHATRKIFNVTLISVKTMSNPTLSSYISYLPNYHILICLSCQCCISPINDGIRLHFRGKHKSIPLKTRNEIIEYTESVSLANPKDVTLPLSDIVPIEGLEVFSGWRCKEKSVNNPSEICRECYTTEISMEKHYRDDHGWTASKGMTWTRQSFQTFFRGNLIKYFPIITLENDESEHILPIEG